MNIVPQDILPEVVLEVQSVIVLDFEEFAGSRSCSFYLAEAEKLRPRRYPSAAYKDAFVS